MRIFQLRSLKTRVTFFTFAIFVFGISSLAYYVNQRLHHDLANEIRQQQLTSVSILAAQINQELVFRLQGLEDTAASFDPGLMTDTKTLQTELEERTVFQRLFNGGTFITSLDGTAIASLPVSVGRVGVNFIERDHVAAALKLGKSTISKPVIGKLLQSPVVSMAAPIRNADGKVMGAVVGVTDLGQPNFLKNITDSPYGNTGGYFIVAKKYRLIVTASDKSRVMEILPPPGVSPSLDSFIGGHEDTQKFINPRRIEVIATAKNIPVADWYLAAALPTAEAFAPIDGMRRQIAMATVILIVLVCGLLWWMLQYQLEPLSETSKRLVSMSNDEQMLQTLPIARQDEIGDLIVSFNQLLKTLAQRDEKIQFFTNMYAALNHCNQAIVRCTHESELLSQICRSVVQFGGMKMAWIGMLDGSGKWVKPVASFGDGIEYLDGIDISIDVNEPTGRGPTGISMRENRPYWCQDFLHDPATSAWHERGSRFGWESSGAVPLLRQGHVVGTLTVYSGTAHVFNDAVKNLLLEMANDISFALDNFDREEQRLKAEATLSKLSLAVAQSPHSIVITDLDANIEYANAAFCKVSGYSLDEAIGHNPRIMQSGKTQKATYENMWAHLTRGDLWRGELLNRRKDGSEFTESALISPVRQAQGQITNYLAIKEDITEKKSAAERIQRLIHFDALTGLPNRIQLFERFNYALILAQRSGEKLTVMVLDIDHFKNINDNFGHSVGDQLLMELARRIKGNLREEDTLSRQGGDEFILLLPDTDGDNAALVASKLLNVVSQPAQCGDHELITTASIGMAIYPSDGSDLETLSKNSEIAMYRVKQDARNSFRFFSQEMQAHSARTLQLNFALRHALERNELHLHYQPQLSLSNGCVVGAEALLRWQHPELGMISPAEFIPVAEDSGQIIPIGEWVMRTAAHQLKMWLERGLPPMVVAVNLSAVQFRQANIADVITRIVDEVQLPHEYFEVELTEAVSMKDPQAAIMVMDSLHALGIRMSIDDFGTGYSSLSYLKKFKINKLKIDQSFVHHLSEDPEDKAIVSTIINLASSPGLHTIAEGVETASQLAFLRLHGCDEVQGYYFSKPLAADEFETFVMNIAPPFDIVQMSSFRPHHRHSCEGGNPDC